ncbi:MAG TPA: hypothetical protein VK208_02990 [Pyrinomonadaceae bacterium]|nr:hypothetical protein [Pyrinomonadaceae bacterium]
MHWPLFKKASEDAQPVRRFQFLAYVFRSGVLRAGAVIFLFGLAGGTLIQAQSQSSAHTLKLDEKSISPPASIADVSWIAGHRKAAARGAAAREAYNTLVSGYGAPSDSATLLAKIAEVERRPPPTETVEGLLATPPPTPEEAQAYIGDWVGDIWMNPDEPRTGKETLRISVENGQVVGEMINPTAPAEFRTQRLQYLRVTPTGLTWGNLNGMRPRGVKLFEGKLEGDTLAGETRWGGIDFRRPDGSKPKEPQFSFKRVGR